MAHLGTHRLGLADLLLRGEIRSVLVNRALVRPPRGVARPAVVLLVGILRPAEEEEGVVVKTRISQEVGAAVRVPPTRRPTPRATRKPRTFDGRLTLASSILVPRSLIKSLCCRFRVPHSSKVGVTTCVWQCVVHPVVGMQLLSGYKR